MKKSENRLIQHYLKQQNLYDGDVDGIRGSLTDNAVNSALEGQAAQLPLGWSEWSSKRKSIACLQLLCVQNGIDAGIIDGLYGPQTQSASQQLKILTDTGTLPRGFGDIYPIRVNPYSFPEETTSALNEYYGEPCEVTLEQVACPWELKLDWNLNQRVHHISIHQKLATSLATVLEQAYNHYGLDGIKSLGLDRYGGSYNCRKKRGSLSAWSTHAWGISIDWFPSRNQLSWDITRASLGHPDADAWWEIWENEGWVSLGRSENRDWMHVQAAKR